MCVWQAVVVSEYMTLSGGMVGCFVVMNCKTVQEFSGCGEEFNGYSQEEYQATDWIRNGHPSIQGLDQLPAFAAAVSEKLPVGCDVLSGVYCNRQWTARRCTAG